MVFGVVAGEADPPRVPRDTRHIGIMCMGGRTPMPCSHIMNMWNICIASITAVTSFGVRGH